MQCTGCVSGVAGIDVCACIRTYMCMCVCIPGGLEVSVIPQGALGAGYESAVCGWDACMYVHVRVYMHSWPCCWVHYLSKRCGCCWDACVELMG